MDLVEGHTNKDFRMSVAPTTCAVWTGETTTGGEACVFPFLYEADGYDNNNHKFYFFCEAQARVRQGSAVKAKGLKA